MKNVVQSRGAEEAADDDDEEEEDDRFCCSPCDEADEEDEDEDEAIRVIMERERGWTLDVIDEEALL